MIPTLRSLVAAALIAPIVATAPPAHAQQPPPPPKEHLRLTGQFGWGGGFDTKTGYSRSGVTRTGRWFPVWVEIENLREKDPFKGTIRITPGGTDHTADRWASMSQQVTVGPQARTRVRLAYRTWSADGAGQQTFRISAVDSLTGQAPKGGTVGAMTGPTHVGDGQLVVTVGDAGVSALAQHLMRSLGGPTTFGKDAPGGRSVPTHLPPEELPARFADYDAADVIVWPRVQGDPIAAAQAQALGEWVRAGGILIMGVGDSAASGAVTRLFPASVGSPVRIRRFDSLPIDSDALRTGRYTARDQDEVLRPLLREQRNPRDAPFVEATDAGPVPWLATQDLGAGKVVLVGSSLTNAPFLQETVEWWRGLADWPDPIAGDGPGPSPRLASRRDGSTEWDGQPMSLAFTTAIADVQPAQDIPFGWLALFLGLYVLVIGPVDYLILKRLNRLEWTFATFTVATVLVTGSAWGVSQYLKGGDMLLRAVEIHTSRANTGGARAEAVWGVFSNAHSDLALSHSDSTAATGMFWIPAAERGGSMGKQCVLEAGPKGVHTPQAPVRIWTTDWFHSVWSADRPAVIEGVLTATADDDGCGGVLKLAAQTDWREVHVLYGDKIWRVAPHWRAGDEIRFDPAAVDTVSDVNDGTLAWERPPAARTDGAPLYTLEAAAWNVMAASVGRQLGDAGSDQHRDRWTGSLSRRPPPGWALVVAMRDGDAEAFRVLRHAPERTSVAVERVWVPVRPAKR